MLQNMNIPVTRNNLPRVHLQPILSVRWSKTATPTMTPMKTMVAVFFCWFLSYHKPDPTMKGGWPKEEL